MNILRKTFIVAAISCAAAWLLKMVAIAATGGAETDASVVGVLWTVGMVTFLLAAGTGTALVLVRAPSWTRVLAGVAAVPVAFALLNYLDAAMKAVYESDGWFRDELSLVVAGVVMGALGISRLGAGQLRGDRLARASRS